MISDSVTLDKKYYGEKSVLIAKSGYGKSYAARVIIEEGLKIGNTFIIVDPQDAYLNIPAFDYINAKNVKSAKGLAVVLAQSNKNVVIQTKGLSIDEQNAFMHQFISAYRINIRKGIHTIVIDEIHKFAPEGQNTESKEDIRGMFQENRSDGLGCIAITQRISRLDKTILSQADHLGIGRVTSYRDKEAVKNYIDNPDDIEKISKLERGDFYLYGFGSDDPRVERIRKAETKHSGNSPENLLTEDSIYYNQHIGKFAKNVKRGNANMADEVETKNEPINKILPSVEGFKDLVAIGAKVALGGALSGVVGGLVSGMIPKSPIPLVSTRTLGAAGTMIGLYALYRFTPEKLMNGAVKDVAKFAAAGAAAYTAGSLIFDAFAFFKVTPPAIAQVALSAASGVVPVSEAKSVDTNTRMG